MKKKFCNKNGETLISVVIGILLVAIIIVGIMSLLIKNYEIENNYDRNNIIFILKNNAENLIRKVDTTDVPEGDVFFIYKNTDPTIRQFQVLYGTGNDAFKYINSRGELVTNTGSYVDDTIYTRIFYTEKKDLSTGDERQIIKGAVKELIRNPLTN